MNVEEYITRGLLIKTDAVYHVTKRGYRSLSRYFVWWLVHQGDKGNISYDDPPYDFELLELDGCTDDSPKQYRKQYYWQHLRKVILAGLSPDELLAIGIAPKKRRYKLPEWCNGLLREAIKDCTESRNQVDPLADEAWGREVKKE